MSFTLNNIIFDRIVGGTVSQCDKVKAWLSELSNINFSVSADPIEITNAMGQVVYRKFNAKSLEITATNAFISADVISLTSGSDMQVATSLKKLEFPKIEEVAVGTTDFKITNRVVGKKVEVYALTNSGAIVKEKVYTESDGEASETAFKIDSSDGTVTFPTLSEEDKKTIGKFLVKYTREVESGFMSANMSDKFAKTSELVFKALAVDPCDQKLRACYIVVPSASISPAVELAIQNGEANTMDFSATGLLNPCAKDKTLFYIAFAEDDTEEGEKNC